MNTPCILQVEDNEYDVFLLQYGFSRAGVAVRLQVVRDGQAAIDYLAGTGAYADRQQFPWPCLVLLDLRLPVRGGMDVLAWIRQQPRLKRLVVVVLSCSANSGDVARAYELGANSFLIKPMGAKPTVQLVRLLKTWWLDLNQTAPIEPPPPQPPAAALNDPLAAPKSRPQASTTCL